MLTNSALSPSLLRMPCLVVVATLWLPLLPLACFVFAQTPQQVPLQCYALPDGTTLAIANCNTSAMSVSLGSGTSAAGFTATALGYQTSASGFAATAMGYQCSASGSTSFAGGSQTQTFSDPEVPGGSSAGGAFSFGNTCKSSGDWSLSFGSKSEASGYTSAAVGYGAVAMTWGEVALGLYPEMANMTAEEKRNQSVIPTFHEQDVVLRVGNGCQKLDYLGGIGCETEQRRDALRVYKSGQLYLKKLDGTVVEDVAAEIVALRAEVDGLRTTAIVLGVVCGVLVVGLVAVAAVVMVARKAALNKYSAMN